jgi:hypothetical protein
MVTVNSSSHEISTAGIAQTGLKKKDRKTKQLHKRCTYQNSKWRREKWRPRLANPTAELSAFRNKQTQSMSCTKMFYDSSHTCRHHPDFEK